MGYIGRAKCTGPKRHNVIGVGSSQYDVIRFISMTSLGLTPAPDCRTVQSRGRFCKPVASFQVVVVALDYRKLQEPEKRFQGGSMIIHDFLK